jgi:putative FmdB family regulatory protein
MPIYEYKCQKCGVVEVMQRITEEPLRRCPHCKGKVERLLSRSSFILKGSGWYATDYARKGTSSASTAASTSGSTNGASANGSSTPSEPSSKAPEPASKTGADKPATKATD